MILQRLEVSSTGPVTGSGEVQVITVDGDLADTFIVGLDGAYTGKTHIMQMLDIIISTHTLHLLLLLLVCLSVCLFLCIVTITITVYFIHPSGKLKLSFDHTTKNI